MNNEVVLNESLMDKIIIPDSKNANSDFNEFGFFIQNGKYFTKIRGKNDISIDVDISNFVMKSLYNMINGTNNSSRIIFIKRYSKERNLLEVKSSDLKPDTFETILKSFGCTFYGSSYQLKKIFAHLMDEEKTANIIEVLGWNDEHEIYVFADSFLTSENKLLVVDEMGMIDYNKKNYYLPAFGQANLKNADYSIEKTFKFRPGKIDFKTWSDLFFKSSGDKAIIGMLYSIMACYRDLIFHKFGFFPFLYLFGDKGTGKSQFTQRMLLLFGSDTTGTPLNNATVVALNRLVSSRSNSLFYFKEYTTETDLLAENFILSGYDGAGRETGVKSNDTKTKRFPILSGIAFDGNALPRKSNILSRMILLSFESTTFTNEEKTSFDKLREYSEYGFGNVLLEILSIRKNFKIELKEEFKKSELRIKTLIQNNEEFNSLKTADERLLQHTYILLTVFSICNKYIDFPFSTEQAENAILSNAVSLNSILIQTSVTSIFWESFSHNIKKGLFQEYAESDAMPINNKNAVYRIKYSSAEILLQIKLQAYYPFYVKYCKDNGMRFLDSNSLRLILTSTNNQSFIQSQQKGRNRAYTDSKFGSCYQFKLEESENKNSFILDNVEISL